MHSKKSRFGQDATIPFLLLTAKQSPNAKPNNYISLQHKISNLNKHILKTDLHESYLIKLEKSVLRGEPLEAKEPKATRLFKSPKASLKAPFTYRKQPRAGVNIIKLPKLPFGKHVSYNNVQDFTKTHLISHNRAEGEEIETLLKTVKKDLKVNRTAPYQRKIGKNAELTDYKVFYTKTGRLVCLINKQVLKAYDQDNQRFKKTQKRAVSRKNRAELKENVRKLEMCVERLYPGSRAEHSSLFEKELPSL